MEVIGDFHLHSRFSRATSRELNLIQLHLWAQRKGLQLVGTGDLTHPAWRQELREALVPAGEGVFALRPELKRRAEEGLPTSLRRPVRFLLTGEIANIYRQGGRTRKIHTVVFAPTFAAADRIAAALARRGNIAADGRPILGITARDLLAIVLEEGEGSFLVPAHIWTPWFSLFGSRSGFDSLEECFGELSAHIFAVETGLSADPAMCRRLSALDRLVLISNSDAHSPARLGREANVFRVAELPDFPALRRIWETREGWGGTIEFFPEEGKYHYDGHRACGVRLAPAEAAALGGRCPRCGKPVTRGVLARVEELADRAEPRLTEPYEMLVPLPEVLAEVLGVRGETKGVKRLYEELLARLGPELEILRAVPLAEIARVGGGILAQAIERMRRGELYVEPGYDGVFGVVRLFRPGERERLAGQGSLFAVSAGEPLRRAVPVRRKPQAEAARRNPQAEAAPSSSLLRGGPERGTSPPLRLDPDQERAVTAPPGPLLIVAGPGTGKTRVLTERILHRIEGGIPPEAVLALTFTNRAAGELAERLAGRLGERGRAVRVCTFHALGLSILREEGEALGLPPGFRVLGAGAAAALRREAGAAGYDAAKAAHGVVDYEDLLSLPLRVFAERPEVRKRWADRFRFIAVDECQDLSPEQYALLRALAPAGSDVTAIGDPEQAIYGFRGADAGFFGRFAADHPGARTVRLSRSYRSRRPILVAAAALTDSPPLKAMRGDGEPLEVLAAPDPGAEARLIATRLVAFLGGLHEGRLGAGEWSLGDVAVLFRLRLQADPIADALAQAGLPCQLAGEGVLLEDPRVARAAAELAGGEGPVAARIRGKVGDPVLGAQLEALAQPFGEDLQGFLDRLALLRMEDLFHPEAERVSLLTLHAAKGLEFPVVVVAGVEEGLLPFQGFGGERPDPAEERRLFYVGLTRARERVVLTWSRRRRVFGRALPGRASPLLKRLPRSVVRAAEGGVRAEPAQPTLFR